jgi:hypothetical protein
VTFRDEILKNIDAKLIQDDDFLNGCLAIHQTVDSKFKTRHWKTPKKDLPHKALILKPKSSLKINNLDCT